MHGLVRSASRTTAARRHFKWSAHLVRMPSLARHDSIAHAFPHWMQHVASASLSQGSRHRVTARSLAYIARSNAGFCKLMHVVAHAMADGSSIENHDFAIQDEQHMCTFAQHR